MTDRNRTILNSQRLVHLIAHSFLKRVPPSVEFDDLASAGMLGLIQAADRFDSGRKLKFETYAAHRIRGAMMDFLREEDPLSRKERQRVGKCHVNTSLEELANPERYLPPVQPDTSCETRADLKRFRKCLSLRENVVIDLYFNRGLELTQIGGYLRVTQGRVSQIKKRALSKLRLEVAA